MHDPIIRKLFIEWEDGFSSVGIKKVGAGQGSML